MSTDILTKAKRQPRQMRPNAANTRYHTALARGGGYTISGQENGEFYDLESAEMMFVAHAANMHEMLLSTLKAIQQHERAVKTACRLPDNIRASLDSAIKLGEWRT